MKIDSEKRLNRSKLKELLESIYQDHNSEEINLVFNQLLQILDEFQKKSGYEEINNLITWDQTHSVLITYADSIQKPGEPTLCTLRKLLKIYFKDLSSVLHVLPFLKSTSDGGFRCFKS